MQGATMQETPEELATRRRRVRNTALKLAAFAVVVYVGSVIAFIYRHQ
jgi:hypothetical protein